MERLPRGKHPSLLQKSINYSRKKFYSRGSRPVKNTPAYFAHSSVKKKKSFFYSSDTKKSSVDKDDAGDVDVDGFG
jgi:hypothetical protein